MIRETQKSSFNGVIFGIVLSLALHALLLVFRSERFSTPPPIDQGTPIEVGSLSKEMLEQLNRPSPEKVRPQVPIKEQEIAESEDAGNREEDPDARFLSDKTQKAKEQMRAKRIDDFKKETGTGKKGKGNLETPPNPTEGETGESNEATLAVTEGVIPEKQLKGNASKKNWRSLTLQDLSVGTSGDGGETGATDDHLRGVDDGGRTVLSTREFRYFSYYHRIKELLRQHWRPLVEKKVYLVFEKGKVMEEDEITTRVLVLLNDVGRIQKISRVTSSGFEDIDQAAFEAFKLAEPFPNPPKGIIEDDGFVRIRWDFILRTEAAPRIQFQSMGGGRSPP